MNTLLPSHIMQKAVKGLGYIAHPLRLRILEYLDVNGNASVSQITKALGVEQAIVSQSLKKMREMELVQTRRSGVFVYYGLMGEYPASLFVCIRKMFGYMTDNFYFLQEGYKVILPRDYTTMVANRIKLFAHIDKMRILEYLAVFGPKAVCDIAEALDLEPIKVSQFLKKMKEDDFVSCERHGRFVVYDMTKGVHRTALGCIHKRYNALSDKEAF